MYTGRSKITRVHPPAETTPSQMAIMWACQVLLAAGCTVIATGAREFDIELPDGSWLAANTVAELCARARGLGR